MHGRKPPIDFEALPPHVLEALDWLVQQYREHRRAASKEADPPATGPGFGGTHIPAPSVHPFRRDVAAEEQAKRETERAIPFAKEPLRTLLEIRLATGFSTEHVRSLRWSAVDLRRGAIRPRLDSDERILIPEELRLKLATWHRPGVRYVIRKNLETDTYVKKNELWDLVKEFELETGLKVPHLEWHVDTTY